MLSSITPDKFRNRRLSEIRPLNPTYKNVDMQYIFVILLKTSNSTYIVQSSLALVYTRASQNVSRHADEFENCFQLCCGKFDQPQGDSGFNKKNISCMLINFVFIKKFRYSNKSVLYNDVIFKVCLICGRLCSNIARNFVLLELLKRWASKSSESFITVSCSKLRLVSENMNIHQH